MCFERILLHLKPVLKMHYPICLEQAATRVSVRTTAVVMLTNNDTQSITNPTFMFVIFEHIKLISRL